MRLQSIHAALHGQSPDRRGNIKSVLHTMRGEVTCSDRGNRNRHILDILPAFVGGDAFLQQPERPP